METTVAYLAGAIDLDGYIVIRRVPRIRDRTRYSFAPGVGLTDGSPLIPDLLQEYFPASRRDYEPKKPGLSPTCMWDAHGRTARRPLIHLLPHLRIQRRQAELALRLLELLEIIDNHKKWGTMTPTPAQDDAMSLLFEEYRQITPSRRRRKERI
jgi:hypothetical protein